VKTRHFGRDRIELDGDRLTIVTPVGMTGWEVRRYRSPQIRFEGRTWRIVARTRTAERATRYELVAWEPLDGEIPGPEIEYTAEFVAFRDHAGEIGRRRSRVTGALGFVVPFTGFLPARTKDRLETVYGIDPVASTSASVFIEFFLALGAIALATIATMTGAFAFVARLRGSAELPAFGLIAFAVVLLVDAAVRWSRLEAEERPAPGFYEWLFRRRSQV
jgi:hypothetical protein